MGSQTASRNRKRSSSQLCNPDSSNGTSSAKRLRSLEDGKENLSGNGMGTDPDTSLRNLSESGGTSQTDRAVNVIGKPPEAGVIQKIYVENFMCHRKFTVELCRNVNFIYGQNGSGKSAILAAIQICLGAGARRTHRARNLKDLVRKDGACNNAKIRVTLLNRGDDGYQHDVYGDSICVERTIALRGGYNGYKLYDSEMRERSRSKKDLDEMLDKLNIQVENPVAILDQEEAKKFLTGKSEDKYNFFMKATELERIDRTYASAIDRVAELDTQSLRMNQGLEADMLLVEKTKKKWEEHKEIEKLEAKLRAYHEAFAWSCHKECSTKLKQEIEHIEKFKEKAEKHKEKLSQAEEAANGTDEIENGKRKKLDELTYEAKTQTHKKKDLEQELKRAMEPQKGLERQLKYIKKEQSSASESYRRASQRLQKRREEIVARTGSAESEEANRNRMLQEAETELVAKKEKNSQLKQEVTDALKAYEEVEPSVEQARQDLKATENKLYAAESRVEGLKSSDNNSLAMFGPKCTRVKQLVDRLTQQQRFKGQVLGPIGSYLKIVEGKEDFASIAECAIGHGTLDRFIVTNDHDRKLFQRIRKDAGCQQDCGVFQMHQHPRYSIPNPPVDGIETVASVLSIADDTIFNCLVDNCKMEERALSRSRNESERLLLVKDDRGRNAIRGKIKEVYCMPAGDKWTVKNGNIAMIGNEKRLKKNIGVDKSSAIEQASREVVALRDEVAQARKEESKLQHEHHSLSKKWNIKKREHRENVKLINALVSRIDNIKEEQISAQTFDTDTTEYEEAVAEAQRAIDELKDKEAALKNEYDTNEPDILQKKAQLEEITIRNEKVLAEMKEAEDDLAAYFRNLSQRQEKLEKRRDKVREYEDIISKQQERVEEINNDVRRYMKQAKTLSFRRALWEKQENDGGIDESQLSQEPTDEQLEDIPIKETDKEPTFYEARVRRAQKKIQDERQRRDATRDDPVIAYEKYSRAKQQLETKVKKIAEIDRTSSQIKMDMAERKQRWRQFRDHIGKTTDQRFDEVLNLKGSSGEIDFDHQNKQLNLIVQKDSADANSQQKDVKALSGGERSYTTIALLLALGESLETPFRVLDEFDVFLDPITRKLTIEALIKMAKALQHRQFIFITPQDVSNVEVDPMLKVVKMKPPERNNMVGLPAQQTLEF